MLKGDSFSFDAVDSIPPYIILFMAEFLGTAILMFIGCMGCVVYFADPATPAFSFGFAVLAAVQTFGHISGAHINPAVSLGVLILGRMTLIEFAIYLVAQYTGAVVGYSFLWFVMPQLTKDYEGVVKDEFGFCVLKLGECMNPIKVLFVEVITSFILMIAICGVLDRKNRYKNDSTSIRIGLVVAGIILAALPLSSAGLNPARAIPPSLLTNSWSHHWVWHLGPYAGMALAAVFYRFVMDSYEPHSLYSYILSI